jgi:hypothetical protein
MDIFIIRNPLRHAFAIIYRVGKRLPIVGDLRIGPLCFLGCLQNVGNFLLAGIEHQVSSMLNGRKASAALATPPEREKDFREGIVEVPLVGTLCHQPLTRLNLWYEV